jgi:hypothetical protein
VRSEEEMLELGCGGHAVHDFVCFHAPFGETPMLTRCKPDDSPMMTRSRSGYHRVCIGVSSGLSRKTRERFGARNAKDPRVILLVMTLSWRFLPTTHAQRAVKTRCPHAPDRVLSVSSACLARIASQWRSRKDLDRQGTCESRGIPGRRQQQSSFRFGK